MLTQKKHFFIKGLVKVSTGWVFGTGPDHRKCFVFSECSYFTFSDWTLALKLHLCLSLSLSDTHPPSITHAVSSLHCLSRFCILPLKCLSGCILSLFLCVFVRSSFPPFSTLCRFVGINITWDVLFIIKLAKVWRKRIFFLFLDRDSREEVNVIKCVLWLF